MKPNYYHNRGINFNALNTREFEEIVYWYFKDQIDKGIYIGMYDDVKLSSGSADKGIDINLFYQQKIVGIIQCKRYDSHLSDKVVFEELVKFLLNHLKECIENKSSSSSLIYSIEDFTYYFVVSKGFTDKANRLIASFSDRWKEQNLESTLKKVLAKNKLLSNLDAADVMEDLKILLGQIRVKSLIGVDLEPIILNNEDIMNRYFSSPFQNVYKFPNDTFPKLLSKEEVLQKTLEIAEPIKQVNTELKSYQEIERGEVSDILEWINTPHTKENDNIAVISGNAGMGKTVVVAQLYKRLQEKGIPVVCFKADYLSFDSTTEFEKELKLGVSLEELITQYVGESEVGVILIDQIDALSQTLSSNLKPLKVYDRLIRNLLRNPKFKVIVSCRIYDLNYDPIIATYKKKNVFQIKELDEEEVFYILEKRVGINKRSISSGLIALLRVPLHLATFLKIYDKNLDFDKIKSVQDLYDILWNNKVVNSKSLYKPSVDFKRVEQLVFEIAEGMYKDQKINISSISFKFYTQELNYLKSEGILKGDKKLEFFHQSFFDYAFARQFITTGKELCNEIKAKHQGLFIRSMVKQILNFLRGNNPEAYIKEIEQLIFNEEEIRFHLRLLCLQQLAFQAYPTRREVDLVIEKIWTNSTLKEIFMTLLFGKGWFKFFVEKELLEKEIKNGITKEDLVIRNLLRQFVDGDLEVYLDFLLLNKDIVGIEVLVIDFFWKIKNIENQKILEVADLIFDKHEAFEKDFYPFSLVLEKAAIPYPDWVVNKIKSLVDIKTLEEEQHEMLCFPGSHHHSSVYKTLWEHHPRKAYLLVKGIIQEIIEKRTYPNSLNYHVHIDQDYYSYKRKNLDLPSNYHYEQLERLQTYIETECESDFDFFQKEVQFFIKSSNLTELIIALDVVHRYPSLFWQDFFELFSFTEKLKQLFSLGEYPKYLICKSLGVCYPHFPKETKEKVDEIILNFATDSETKLIDYGNGKKVQRKYYGISKYNLLNELSSVERGKNPKLQKLYLELKRKFGELENKEPQGIVVNHINNDLDEDAYSRMSNENWKKSFRTYTSQNLEYNRFKQPDNISHGRKFRECVAEDLNRFTKFVNELMIDSTIPNEYKVFGLEGLTLGKLDKKSFFLVFKQAIEHNTFNDYELKELINLSQYLSNYIEADPFIKAFIKDLVINGSEEKQSTIDDYSAGRYSVRGAAVDRVMDLAFNKKHYQFVVNILDYIVENASSATRACAIAKLGNLWNVVDDRNILIDYFYKLTYDYTSGLVRISHNLLYHLIDIDFNALIPFMKKAMFVEKAHTTVGPTLVKAYCYKMEGAKDLLENFYSINSECVKSAVDWAFEFIKNGDKEDKALEIIGRFLNSREKTVAQSYTLIFYHLEPKSFQKLYPYFKEYTKSNVGRYIDNAFYNYLEKCAYDFPKKCIELTANFSNHFGPQASIRSLRNEPLKVLILAYNAIREYRRDDPVLEKAMDTFDGLLQDENYRALAFGVLEDVDLY